ncbi:HipA domain-containing protein [Rhodoferax sp. U11-2br]|nr:HipA domain-containing protein [Rhodoferax sp. U11-2br]
MAVKSGIDMSPCRLLEENGRAHFMTRRFDRALGNARHHRQTLCAMNHLDYKKKGTNSSFAHNPKGEWTHQHLMSINGRFKDFALADLLTLADRFGLGSAATVIDQVLTSVVCGSPCPFDDLADVCDPPSSAKNTPQQVKDTQGYWGH